MRESNPLHGSILQLNLTSEEGPTSVHVAPSDAIVFINPKIVTMFNNEVDLLIIFNLFNLLSLFIITPPRNFKTNVNSPTKANAS